MKTLSFRNFLRHIIGNVLEGTVWSKKKVNSSGLLLVYYSTRESEVYERSANVNFI